MTSRLDSSNSKDSNMVVTSVQFQDAINQINAKFEQLENKIKELESKNEAKKPAQTRKTKQEAA